MPMVWLLWETKPTADAAAEWNCFNKRKGVATSNKKSMPSLFTRIVQGEIPAHKVAETQLCLAFLDINPLVKGHTLVIPKQEVDYVFDIDDHLLAELMLFAKKVAKAVQSSVPCKRVGVAVIGLEVPHAHVHLVPLNAIGDINFSKPKLNPTKEELIQTADAIRTAYQNLNE
jgi:histidine triad (HIT) family protein